MPRYHFNVRDGRNLPDRKGMLLPDLKAARREAIRLAGAILEDESARLDLGTDWHMDVTDNAGLILFRLDFMVIEAPATLGQIKL